MRVLFVENGDSFSWNVIDRLPFSRGEIRVVPGAEPSRVRAALLEAERLVIGPGPMDPERAGLVGLVELAAARGLPTLGICLGHQALGLAFGARLVRTEPAHGVRAKAIFGSSARFPGIAGPHEVMRYHSLTLEDVRAPLRTIATTDDGLVMGVEHASLPMAGLQFHPDSFGTPSGEQMLAAFFRSVG